MSYEIGVLVAYLRAVGKYWWAIATGLVLSLLDLVERLLGTWFVAPLWLRLATAVAGLVVAQYLAYRDLSKSHPDTTSNFKDQLRHVLRRAELEWAPVDVPDKTVSPQLVCKQIDAFRAAVAEFYTLCPNALNSQPLRDAIEKLDATKAHRIGNLIGSQHELDQVCEQMRAALADVRSMV